MSVYGRRRATALIEAVSVRPGTAAVRERVLIAPRGKGPVDGRADGGAGRPVVVSEHHWFEPAGEPRWDEQRVAGELRAFIGAGGSWPDDADFMAAGRGPLLRGARGRRPSMGTGARARSAPRAQARLLDR